MPLTDNDRAALWLLPFFQRAAEHSAHFPALMSALASERAKDGAQFVPARAVLNVLARVLEEGGEERAERCAALLAVPGEWWPENSKREQASALDKALAKEEMDNPFLAKKRWRLPLANAARLKDSACLRILAGFAKERPSSFLGHWTEGLCAAVESESRECVEVLLAEKPARTAATPVCQASPLVVFALPELAARPKASERWEDGAFSALLLAAKMAASELATRLSMEIGLDAAAAMEINEKSILTEAVAGANFRKDRERERVAILSMAAQSSSAAAIKKALKLADQRGFDAGSDELAHWAAPEDAAWAFARAGKKKMPRWAARQEGQQMRQAMDEAAARRGRPDAIQIPQTASRSGKRL